MKKRMRIKSRTLIILCLYFLSCVSLEAVADTFVVDLSHVHGSFAPKKGDIGVPDLSKPNKDSIPVPIFGVQGVQEVLPDFPTNLGPIKEGRFTLHEHFGTHVDAPAHFLNTKESLEIEVPDTRTAEALTVDDLYGPIVFLDISDRVQAELDKNGGKPGPLSVTDFSNTSNNGIRAADIAAVEDKIRDGVWVVANAGWSRFYTAGIEDKNKSPYINGWNYPGFSPAACDKLIEIEDRKGIRINGIVMDNMAIGSGETGYGSKGEGDGHTNVWMCHVRGRQRGWLLVESVANLGQLAKAKADSCNLFVGAIKLANAAGVPARVIAICES